MRRALLLVLWISLFIILVQPLTVNAQDIVIPPDSVWGISWSPEGTRIAVGRWQGLVEIQDAASGQVVQSLQIDPPSKLVAVAWSPDGSKLAATATDRLLYIWDMSSGQLLHALQGQNTNYLTGISWSPGSDRIAAISQLDGALEIWNASSGALLNTTWAGPLAGIDWIDNRLVTGTGPGVDLRDATTGQYIKMIGLHDAYVIAVAWSPDGNRVASGGMDGTLRIWDEQANQPLYVFSGYTLPVTWVDWSPDGTKIAGASYDGSIRVWDTTTGQPIEVIQLGAPVLTVQWSPDGGHLAYAGDVVGLGSVVTVAAAPEAPTPTPASTYTPTNTLTPEPTATETPLPTSTPTLSSTPTSTQSPTPSTTLPPTLSATITPTSPPNQIINGDFSSELNNWVFTSDLRKTVISGVLNVYRANSSSGGAVTQSMSFSTSVGQALEASLLMGNLSDTPKSVSVTVRSADVNSPDAITCLYTVPAYADLTIYHLMGPVGSGWTGTGVVFEIVIATVDRTSYLQVDNVEVRQHTSTSLTEIDCFAGLPHPTPTPSPTLIPL